MQPDHKGPRKFRPMHPRRDETNVTRPRPTSDICVLFGRPS